MDKLYIESRFKRLKLIKSDDDNELKAFIDKIYEEGFQDGLEVQQEEIRRD